MVANILTSALRQQAMDTVRTSSVFSSSSSSAALFSSSSRSSLAAPPTSSTNQAPAAKGAAASKTSTVGQGEEFLGWERYLQLRNSRRMAGLITTIPTTLLAGTTAGSYFLTLEVDPSNAIAGIDPTFVYIGLTLASTGLGWLVGPTIGSSIWSLLHRGHAKQIAHKDHDFYEHIKRMRVDPTRQSVQNPVPDYYGEKVGSIKQYRQWLRDQAAYRRKAAHGLEEDA